MDTVINFSKVFISVTQNHQVAATAKHFPGHGFVAGDTHKKLVYIDGEMKEVKKLCSYDRTWSYIYYGLSLSYQKQP